MGILLACVSSLIGGSGCEGEDRPPHSCSGVAVHLIAASSAPEEQEELRALGDLIAEELPGFRCSGWGELTCAEGDVCGGQSLEAEEVLAMIRSLLERERPDLVSAANPQLDPCPCRIY